MEIGKKCQWQEKESRKTKKKMMILDLWILIMKILMKDRQGVLLGK